MCVRGVAVWAYPGIEVSTESAGINHLILLEELMLDLLLGLIFPM